MKVLFTTLLLLFGSLFTTFAQTPTWQWGKRGGSNASNENESIKDIATDPNGNVYILSQVKYTAGGSATLDVAGNAIVGKGFTDVLLSSFTCNGTYRWSKAFGGTSVDAPGHLETDTLGGVYFTARFNNISSPIELSSDTTLSALTWRFMYLVKYDTSGNYQWVARPQSSTTAVGDNSSPQGLQVDGGGNVYWLAHLLPNSYGDGTFQVNTYSLNVLKYDRNGLFQGGIPMDIVANTFPFYYQELFFTRNHKSGKMFVSGYAQSQSTAPFSFGTTNINKAMFVGAFSPTGTSLWTKQSSTSGGNRFFTEASSDDSGNLYIAGNAFPGESFAGSAPFTNPYGNTVNVGIYVKLDSNGNLVSAKNSYAKTVISANHGAYANGEFIIAGGFTSTVKWPGLNDSADKISSGGDLGFYTTRFNASTGQPIAIGGLQSTNLTSVYPDVAHADRKGNVYFGGQMDRDVVVAGSTLTAAGNQRSDFFLAKYGYSNCNCVVPVASIVQSNIDNAARSAAFQYTGTTTGIDSIVFVWGNGLRLRLTNNFNAVITQYYGTNKDTFNVCVTAYSSGCGNNTACRTLQFTPVGIEQVVSAGGAQLQLAPNPAINTTEVTYSLQGNNGSLEVYDLAGRLLSRKALGQKTGTETLSLTDYVAGVYMVVLREEGGATQYRRLVVAK